MSKLKTNFWKTLCTSLFLCFLCACSFGTNDLTRWMQPNGRIKVLSTTGMIHDLLTQIGGDRVDGIILIQGDLDPHSYQLVKGDDEKLQFADIIFYSGLGLEHGPSLRKYLEGDSKAVSLGDFIASKKPEAILKYEGQPDPHIWMDLSLWAEAIPVVVQTLSAKDPAHAAIFKERGEAAASSMQKAHAQARAILQEVPDEKRYLVTSHDAFNYFTRAYLASDAERSSGQWQERFAAPEGLAPESQLSPLHIQQILDHVEKFHIQVLFPESNVSKDSIRKILLAGKEKGLHLVMSSSALYGDAMGPPGSEGDTHLKMIIYNAKTIATLLKKTFADQEHP